MKFGKAINSGGGSRLLMDGGWRSFLVQIASSAIVIRYGRSFRHLF